MLSDDVARRVASHPPSVPEWLPAVVRVVVLVLMVWHGWHWTAAAFIISLVLLSRSPTDDDMAQGGAGAARE